MSTFVRVLRKHETILSAYAFAIAIIGIATVEETRLGDPIRFYLASAIFSLLTAIVIGFGAMYEIVEAHASDRVQPDDEIVFHGTFHMERMQDDHIWFNIGGATFDLWAIKHRGKTKLTWKPQVNWTNVASVLGWPFPSSRARQR